MRQIPLYDINGEFAPKTVDSAISPDIDSSYIRINYSGVRIQVKTDNYCGIKQWGSRASSQQGMAVYEDMLVSFSNGGSHYIYLIGNNGTLSQVATFTLATGHSNALQFSPILESGQFVPYLYVSDANGKCYVVSIAPDYTASIVQTITVGVGQVLIGDDGYIWTSERNGTVSRRIFKKYRRVSVSEGDVTLTTDDVLDEFDTDKIYSTSDVTAQGWSVKYGKIWFCYGQSGDGQKRGVDVYDTATHRRLTELDFTNYTGLELEDVDFYNNTMLVSTYSTTIFEVRF